MSSTSPHGSCQTSRPCNLIGGKLEDLILYHLNDLFRVEEGFIADWVAKHH
ncbi:Protein of uncharacterised function (DUF2505) [Mycobacteroides abscessus]|nr:Protein of uncharacterised function (DUF2505) [Mycobacteroides abscessus]